MSTVSPCPESAQGLPHAHTLNTAPCGLQEHGELLFLINYLVSSTLLSPHQRLRVPERLALSPCLSFLHYKMRLQLGLSNMD